MAADTDVEVRSIGAVDEPELLQAVKRLHPDVLILDESSPAAASVGLQKLITSLPNLRVIVVNQENNVLRIYQGERVQEGKAQDLAKAIHSKGPGSRSD